MLVVSLVVGYGAVLAALLCCGAVSSNLCLFLTFLFLTEDLQASVEQSCEFGDTLMGVSYDITQSHSTRINPG